MWPGVTFSDLIVTGHPVTVKFQVNDNYSLAVFGTYFYIKKLFIAFLNFEFNWASVRCLAKLPGAWLKVTAESTIF